MFPRAHWTKLQLFALDPVDLALSKTKRMGTLAEFFASSPLRASGLKVKRSKEKLRSADL
jgi:hypothetical protein